jgi:GTP cyclohydrolase IA
LVEWVASRPQIQEELVTQIADELSNLLEAKGVAVTIKATHFCMTWRGVKEGPNALMTTSVMRGSFTKPETRNEFLSLIAKP